jgi:hypothetical protein
MIDALRAAAEGSQVAITLADPVEVDDTTYDIGVLIIESLQDLDTTVDTTADRRLAVSGAEAAATASDGEIDHWKIVAKRFDCEWSRPTVAGWYWDGLDYESTPYVGVESIAITPPDSSDDADVDNENSDAGEDGDPAVVN